MIYEYVCKTCNHQQEKMVKMGETTKEPCEKCNAPTEQLQRILSAHSVHGSWSRWNVI